jgi:hypothetical protein
MEEEESLSALIFQRLRPTASSLPSSSSTLSSSSVQQLEDYEAYLGELASQPLDRLVKEPSILSEMSSKVRSEMEELAFSNYKSFIQTSDCIRDVHREITEGTETMKELLDSLQSMSKSCEKFSVSSHEISEMRSQNRMALQHHNQLIEMLEIPQLMDTCVRNGFYDEALELEAFSQKLQKLHGDIPIIHEIANDVKSSTEVMLRELLFKLKTNIQLPQCLRIIGFLRRLGVYNELQLRICFLKSRDVWLNSVIDNIPTGNAYSFVSRHEGPFLSFFFFFLPPSFPPIPCYLLRHLLDLHLFVLSSYSSLFSLLPLSVGQTH